ncbi:hypothetical protein ACT3UJ_06890 [Halomonas sp. 86]
MIPSLSVSNALGLIVAITVLSLFGQVLATQWRGKMSRFQERLLHALCTLQSAGLHSAWKREVTTAKVSILRPVDPINDPRWAAYDAPAYQRRGLTLSFEAES